MIIGLAGRLVLTAYTLISVATSLPEWQLLSILLVLLVFKCIDFKLIKNPSLRAKLESVPELLLGVCIPLAGVAGIDLTAVATLYILLFVSRENFRICEAFQPLLAMAAGWFIVQTVILLPVFWQNHIIVERGLSLFNNFSHNSSEYSQCFLLFVQLLIFCILFSYVSKVPEKQEFFILAVATGTFCSLIVLLFQINGVSFDANQTLFWASQKRFSAGFSDPNSFGVAAALTLPVLLLANFRSKKGRLTVLALRLLGVALSIGALYSGSRTFILGFFVVIVYLLLIKRKVNLNRGFLLTVSGFAGLLLFFVFNQGLMPAVISRSIDKGLDGSFFESRSLYWRMALEIGERTNFLGVGPGNFMRASSGFAMEYLGSYWLDNANSFYLGLLTEYGFAGALALLVSFFMLYFSRADREDAELAKAGRVACFVLPAVLLTGPHLQFSEVCILSALVTGAAFGTMVFNQKLLQALNLVFLCASVFCALQSQPFMRVGLYTPELEGGVPTQWSRQNFRSFAVCNKETDMAEVDIASGAPLSAGIYPLNFELKSRDYILNESFEGPGRRVVKIKCDKLAVVYYQAEVENTWIPENNGIPGDRRSLGVRLYLHDLNRFLTPQLAGAG